MVVVEGVVSEVKEGSGLETADVSDAPGDDGGEFGEV